MTKIEKEAERFFKLWESAKVVNPNGFNQLLVLYLATLDPKIISKVEQKIHDRYDYENF